MAMGAYFIVDKMIERTCGTLVPSHTQTNVRTGSIIAKTLDKPTEATLSKSSSSSSCIPFDLAAYKEKMTLEVKEDGNGGGEDDRVFTEFPFFFNSEKFREASFNPQVDGQYIIDIGANRGRVSNQFVESYSNIMCHRINDNFGRLTCPNKGISIIAVEAFPPTYKVLAEMADKLNWTSWGDYHLFNFAMDETAVGDVTMFSKGEAGNEESAINLAAARAGDPVTVEVPRMNIDTLLSTLNIQDRWGYLVKIDTEGNDPWVILGAKETLKKKKIRFLYFEINGKYIYNVNMNRPFLDKVHPGTGEAMAMRYEWLIEWLYTNFDYECYLFTSKNLIPIYGKFWDDRYNLLQWSNILCSLKGNTDMDRLVAIHNIDSKLPGPASNLCI